MGMLNLRKQLLVLVNSSGCYIFFLHVSHIVVHVKQEHTNLMAAFWIRKHLLSFTFMAPKRISEMSFWLLNIVHLRYMKNHKNDNILHLLLLYPLKKLFIYLILPLNPQNNFRIVASSFSKWVPKLQMLSEWFGRCLHYMPRKYPKSGYIPMCLLWKIRLYLFPWWLAFRINVWPGVSLMLV